MVNGQATPPVMMTMPNGGGRGPGPSGRTPRPAGGGWTWIASRSCARRAQRRRRNPRGPGRVRPGDGRRTPNRRPLVEPARRTSNCRPGASATPPLDHALAPSPESMRAGRAALAVAGRERCRFHFGAEPLGSSSSSSSSEDLSLALWIFSRSFSTGRMKNAFSRSSAIVLRRTLASPPSTRR